jgi:hypothetical protein
VSKSLFLLLRRIAPVCLAVALTGCVTFDYSSTRPGTLSGALIVMWVGENKFVFAPDLTDPLKFTRRSGEVIRPGLMYTDGGSIPRIAQPLAGFSPWGYAPAYMIHDWIFVGRHCLVDDIDTARFQSLKNISFDESALILAEVIKTLIETKKVPKNEFAFGAISSGVDSFVARGLWDKTGACRENLVSAEDAAMVRNAQLGDRQFSKRFSLPGLRPSAPSPAGRKAVPVARFAF